PGVGCVPGHCADPCRPGQYGGRPVAGVNADDADGRRALFTTEGTEGHGGSTEGGSTKVRGDGASLYRTMMTSSSRRMPCFSRTARLQRSMRARMSSLEAPFSFMMKLAWRGLMTAPPRRVPL